MTTTDDRPTTGLFDTKPVIDPNALSRMVGPLYEEVEFPKVRGIRVLDDLPDLNVDLLSDILLWAYLDKKHMDAAERFPDWGTWNQGTWAASVARGAKTREELKCSSAFCIAGQAVAQSGYAMLFPTDGGSASECAPVRYVNKKQEDGSTKKTRVISRSKTRSIATTARKVLGLTRAEADRMFSGGNELPDVISLGCYFARKRGVSLHLPQMVLDKDKKYTDRRGYASIYG